VRLLLGILLTFLIAATIGLGSAWFALTRGAALGAINIGAWSAWPRNGTADIDPYAHAGIARSGELPVGLGDGVSFVAQRDDGGRSLDGRCDAILRGTTPQARYFTVTLYDPEGRLVANAISRHGFTSQELIRNPDGSVEIAIGPRARSGNWLPTGGIERYKLMLRLYDTPVGVATRTQRDAPMPAIATVGCP